MAFAPVLVAQLAGDRGSSLTYEVSVVKGGAKLTGRVVFEGEVPKPQQLLITRDLEVCGVGFREHADVDVAPAGGLRAVVVYIEGVESGKAWPEAPEGYVLDQIGCYFDPYVQVVRRGAELYIINSDPVLHNIHAYEMIDGRRRTLFNLGQPEEGAIKKALRPRRGEQIRMECDAHDFMLGWIFAVDNPYAVVVDADGHFAIDDIPPGTYAVQAWHPYLGIQDRVVVLHPGGVGEIVFEFSNP
jgi:hypothetical protein